MTIRWKRGFFRAWVVFAVLCANGVERAVGEPSIICGYVLGPDIGRSFDLWLIDNLRMFDLLSIHCLPFLYSSIQQGSKILLIDRNGHTQPRAFELQYIFPDVPFFAILPRTYRDAELVNDTGGECRGGKWR